MAIEPSQLTILDILYFNLIPVVINPFYSSLSVICSTDTLPCDIDSPQ